MINIAIIGMGKIGKTRAQTIKENKHTQLIAAFDVDSSQLDEFGDIIKCSEVDEIFKINDLDAVIICTFNKYAPEYTIKALNTGLHVFCEKPPARTSSEVEAVREVEINKGLILKYGFNHRYHHSVIEAKKLIENNIFGKLLWMRGVYGKAGGNKFSDNWRNNKEESGGGILIDQGIHMLDLLRLFAGDFKEIKSMVKTNYWDIAVEDNAFALMQTDDGIMATIHSSATQWRHKFLLEMSFENGYINLDGILSGTRSYGDETLTIAKRQFENDTFAMGKPREEKIYFDTDESWKLELDEFVECILEKKDVYNGNSYDALKVMQLIEAIYKESGYYEK
ncbi:Gfo/Idh/MocA family protein [Sulfurimonas sp. CS5]|uniref:Gfo/Idh/MocA family protein n=1 Tax=Sulfurimonas sp. CS5 TaxID=3391145 RepID=UPI0039EC14C2